MSEDEPRTAAEAAPGGPVPATFVFADLAGYTALTEAHGDERAADVAAELAREVRALMPAYGAEQVKTIGDALLLRVPAAADAVRLGARVAAALGDRHRALRVRVGMHTGNAVCRDGDWFGAAVNLASRVADLAHAGEVLLTRATLEAAGEALAPGQVRSRGRRHVKNVSRPVELFSLVGDGARPELVVDPVCRMAVDPARAPAAVVHRGVQHHFCSEACAAAFRAAPRSYLARRSRRGDLRVSDAARDSAARRVARAYARGRIDAEELEERIELVWASRTRAELSAATHDLPRRRRGPRPWQAPFWPLVVLARRLRRRAGRRLAAGRQARADALERPSGG